MPHDAGELTILLRRIDQDDNAALGELFGVVYDELNRIARAKLATQPVDHTLQATALVNEFYLKVSRAGDVVGWSDRKHFFRAAARAMQCILVDHARGKRSEKRGGGRTRLPLEAAAIDHDPGVDLVALDDAISSLEADHPRAADVVRLKYFANCTFEEIAEQLDCSVATVERDWTYAKARLRVSLDAE